MSKYYITYNSLINKNGYGRIPDPPEPYECDGEFNCDKCESCSDYKVCKAEAEKLDN